MIVLLTFTSVSSTKFVKIFAKSNVISLRADNDWIFSVFFLPFLPFLEREGNEISLVDRMGIENSSKTADRIFGWRKVLIFRRCHGCNGEIRVKSRLASVSTIFTCRGYIDFRLRR